MEGKMLFFDTETNGLNPKEHSLLSICMIKGEPVFEKDKLKIKIIDIYERFYFPVEEYNFGAISVNGLNEGTIRAKRNGASYPKFFKDDAKALIDFVGMDNKFVAHNIAFDEKFMPFLIDASEKFCTMKNTTDILKLGWNEKFGNYKRPKLVEAVEFFGIDTKDIDADFHDAKFDILCTMKVFEAIYNTGHCKQKILDFIGNSLF
jgi:DNA polymerase III epsilon subunit-like protein